MRPAPGRDAATNRRRSPGVTFGPSDRRVLPRQLGNAQAFRRLRRGKERDVVDRVRQSRAVHRLPPVRAGLRGGALVQPERKRRVPREAGAAQAGPRRSRPDTDARLPQPLPPLRPGAVPPGLPVRCHHPRRRTRAGAGRAEALHRLCHVRRGVPVRCHHLPSVGRRPGTRGPCRRQVRWLYRPGAPGRHAGVRRDLQGRRPGLRRHQRAGPIWRRPSNITGQAACARPVRSSPRRERRRPLCPAGIRWPGGGPGARPPRRRRRLPAAGRPTGRE